MRAQRQAEIESNPYYVKGDAKATKRPTKLASRKDSDDKGVEATPLDLQSPLEIPGKESFKRNYQAFNGTDSVLIHDIEFRLL